MKIHRLQFITDNPQSAEKACAGGVRWIQLRVKNTAVPEWKAIALETRRICSKYGATFIVNDNVEIAQWAGADGVHLGREDMPIHEAGKIEKHGFIIGGTANTIEDMRRLNDSGADYAGLGPFRFTLTKKNLSPVLGLNGYAQIMKHCADEKINLPVIAIGGIQLQDIDELMGTGVHGIAVSSAIGAAENVSDCAGNFVARMNNYEIHEKRFVEHCG